MTARRCTLCGVNYPWLAQFSRCPIHDEDTTTVEGEADEDWKQAFELRQKWANESEELRRHIPLVRGVAVQEETLVNEIEDVVVTMTTLFVDQTELQRGGLRLSRMQPDQFYLFQLEDGWIYETQGWDNPRRRWWVERVIESEEYRPESDLAWELGLVDPKIANGE